jgi:hypothetical protein
LPTQAVFFQSYSNTTPIELQDAPGQSSPFAHVSQSRAGVPVRSSHEGQGGVSGQRGQFNSRLIYAAMRIMYLRRADAHH